jgi:formamidopyrimidine-DNA glycosylase
MRKFAKVTLIQTKELDTSSELSLLGPEPLSPLFTPQMLKSRLLLRPNGKIKSVLMDQRIVSGIGNIYSDEILWASGIHPESRVVNLPPSQIRRIHNAIKTILALGIDFKGDSMSDYRRVDGRPGKFQHHHNAYRQTGKRCSKSKCLGTIARKVIGGRSAHFCNSHQILFQNTLN